MFFKFLFSFLHKTLIETYKISIELLIHVIKMYGIYQMLTSYISFLFIIHLSVKPTHAIKH